MCFNKSFKSLMLYAFYRGVATGEGSGPYSSLLIFETKKVQKFEFQTSKILLFTGAQKLYGSEISRCVLLFLDNIQPLLIFYPHRGNRSFFVGLSEKV